MTGRVPDDCFALPPGVDWTPVDEALALLRERLGPVCGPESVAIGAAAGRILAEPVAAARDNPPVANSAVDGFAFRRADLPEPDAAGSGASLALGTGRAAPGAPLGRALVPGEAVQILTGAALPEGADTVAMQEDCNAGDGRLGLTPPRRAGANVRPAGEDARRGDPLFEAGRRLGPADLARAAVAGVGQVTVRRRLRLGVLSTGDELVQPGEDPGPAGIFDANRPMLLALGQGQGFETRDLGAASDRAEAVRAALDRGAAEADAIVTTGGASAGEEDHVSRLLREEGRVTTWRVAVKPGRPLALGHWRGKPVFGLPGNPVAAFVCYLVFARPALALMAGAAWETPQGYDLPAAFEKRKKPGRREYLRARLDAAGHVEVFRSEGSGLVGGLSWATGLCELGDGARDIRRGDPVRFVPYASFGL